MCWGYDTCASRDVLDTLEIWSWSLKALWTQGLIFDMKLVILYVSIYFMVRLGLSEGQCQTSIYVYMYNHIIFSKQTSCGYEKQSATFYDKLLAILVEGQ